MSESQDPFLAAGKEILRREHAYFRDAALDDAEHIPRIQRIATAISDAARESGARDEAAEALREDLVAYGRELWLDLCFGNLREDDVDPKAHREKCREIFEKVRTADDPWSVYH